MFVLVVGRNKSGKSRYAEKLCSELAGNGPLCYLATMIPYGDGEEGAGCVARHRRQREGYGFETIEHPLRIAEVSPPRGAATLLEDVSNLLANNLFAEGGRAGDAENEVVRDVEAFARKGEHLVAVSIAGLLPGGEFDGPTNHYIQTLNDINKRLFETADAVVEMRNGEPHLIKGSLS